MIFFEESFNSGGLCVNEDIETSYCKNGTDLRSLRRISTTDLYDGSLDLYDGSLRHGRHSSCTHTTHDANQYVQECSRRCEQEVRLLV